MVYDSSGNELGGTMMDVTMFEDLMDRLGEDLSLWPDDQRKAAEDLLASSAAARALHAEARAVRQALTGPPVSAPAGLADRIVAAADKLTAERPVPRAGEEAVQQTPTCPARPGKVLP